MKLLKPFRYFNLKRIFGIWGIMIRLGSFVYDVFVGDNSFMFSFELSWVDDDAQLSVLRLMSSFFVILNVVDGHI